MGNHRSSKVAKRGPKTAASSKRAQNTGKDVRVRFSKQAEEIVQPPAPSIANKEPESPGTPCPPARSTAEAKPKPQARPRPARRRRGQAETHPDGTATLERVAQPSVKLVGSSSTQQHQQQQAASQEATNPNLDLLHQNRYFPQIRELVQQNPELLDTALQQIGIEDPRFCNLVNANQAQFLDLCFEDEVAGSGSAVQGDGAQGNAAQ